jgi:hypothetical protein
LIYGNFAVCRLAPDALIPEWVGTEPLLSLTRTADELSIVCPSDRIPPELKAEKGWICLQLAGPIPFSMTGILASFLDALKGVPIFAISTFDTDYILLKKEFAETSLDLLRDAGHELV